MSTWWSDAQHIIAITQVARGGPGQGLCGYAQQPVLKEPHSTRLGYLLEYYTTYPYLARLRDRNVLEDGVLSTLDSPIDWENQGFALADGWGRTELHRTSASDRLHR